MSQALLAKRDGSRSGRAFGAFPGNADDIAAIEADIGQLVFVQAGQFTQAGIISAPLPDKTENIRNQHCIHDLSSGARIGTL